MTSGPGAMASTAAAAMKRARSGISICAGPGNEKAPCEDGALSGRKEPLGLRRLDAHGVLLLGAVLGELHLAGHHREEGVVLADADVLARVELRAALADDDGARVHELAAVGLDAQALALGIAAVAGRAACFLVCHV